MENKNNSNNELMLVFAKEFGLTVNEQGNVVVNSRTIAEKYGKEHKHVMRDIRNLIDDVPEAQSNFGLCNYINENNREMPEYSMDRQGFSMLVLGFNGKEAKVFTYKYTKAFEEMTEELKYRREQSTEIIKALNEKDEKVARKKLLDSHFGKRKTVSTFKFCDYEQFQGLIVLFEEYVDQIRDTEIKRKEYSRLVDGLTKNRNCLNPNDKMYMPKTTTYSYYIHEYVKKKGSSENKSYGQRLRYKDEIIKDQIEIINEKDESLNNLENTIAYLNPDIEEYMVLDTHGISENYLYEKVFSDYKGEYITVKTNTYKNWIKNFPSHQVTPKEELNVDWNRPIVVFIKFDCMPRFDKQNLLKASIDQLIGREYSENDNIIDKMIVEKNKDVESYKDGKIYFYIRNAD